MFGRGQRLPIYGDGGQCSLKEMGSQVWKKGKKDCEAHWCWLLRGVSASDSVNPSAFISRRGGTSCRVSNCTQRWRLSGMHSASPKLRVQVKPWLVTLRISLYFQALQEVYNPGYWNAPVSCSSWAFFSFFIKKERRNTVTLKKKKKTKMKKVQTTFSFKDKCWWKLYFSALSFFFFNWKACHGWPGINLQLSLPALK